MDANELISDAMSRMDDAAKAFNGFMFLLADNKGDSIPNAEDFYYLLRPIQANIDDALSDLVKVEETLHANQEE